MFANLSVTGFIALLLLYFSLFCEVANAQYKDRFIFTQCTTIVGRLNQMYENEVSRDKPLAYSFFVERKYIRRSHTTNLRVEGGTYKGEGSVKYPLMFSVRQRQTLSSFEVPFQFEDEYTDSRRTSSEEDVFYYAARTLCIEDEDHAQGRNVTIRITTESTKLLKFYVRLKLTEDFQLPTGQPVIIDVSPTAPKYYGFTFDRPDLSRVQIRATSNTTNCMTISIQTMQCPIYDLERNIRYKGKWQTMSTSSTMAVQKYGVYADGFVVVLVAHRDKEVCGRMDDLASQNRSGSSSVGYGRNQANFNLFGSNIVDPRSKTITLIISDESKISDGIILLCLFIPIVVTLLVSLIVLCLFRNRHEWMADILRNYQEAEKPTVTRALVQNGASAENNAASDNDNEDEVELRPSNRARSRPTSTTGNKSYSRKGSDGKVNCRSELKIADFHCKGFFEVKKFAKRFYWTIAIVAIFYSIPVYQLVMHYLRVLYRTGEYDICYYNYLCAHRLGVLIDFNHFWSNASYVIFGIIYIIIVRRRSRNLCLDSVKEDGGENDGGCSCSPCCSRGKVGRACSCTFSRICFRWDHGVPAHFGVFYALGVALTMEGFLSAAYHLCPNQSTFQFGRRKRISLHALMNNSIKNTCFMYVIAVLLLLKIYQFRHPVHFGANQTFAILAGFVMISVLGLGFERGTDKAKLVFKCIFLPVQYIVMLMLCIYYYAVGYVKNDKGELATDYTIYKYLGQLRSQKIHMDRLYLPLISLGICIAVLVYAELSDMEFASYLLYILVGNVLGTTLYYVGIMKPLHGEFKNRTWVQPTLYFLAAGIIGGFSLQYFVRAPAKWELSASASRAENEECLNGWFPFHPYYDSHDAWHFLSAAALFFSFMGLLIVDDDLITTPQTKIPVF